MDRPYPVRNDLKGAIVAKGFTFKEVAARCGVTHQHLSDVLSGRARLTDRLQQQIQESIEQGQAEAVGV